MELYNNEVRIIYIPKFTADSVVKLPFINIKLLNSVLRVTSLIQFVQKPRTADFWIKIGEKKLSLTLGEKN